MVGGKKRTGFWPVNNQVPSLMLLSRETAARIHTRAHVRANTGRARARERTIKRCLLPFLARSPCFCPYSRRNSPFTIGGQGRWASGVHSDFPAIRYSSSRNLCTSPLTSSHTQMLMGISPCTLAQAGESLQSSNKKVHIVEPWSQGASASARDRIPRSVHGTRT